MDDDRDLSSVAALADPVRRALYLQVVRAEEDVGRDRAAEAVGVSRSLAAFHLDRLVDDGLLEASYRRLSGRTGPGAGRPAKVYRPGRDVSVRIPARDYERAARLLMEGVRSARGPDRSGLERTARREGRRVGAEARRAIPGRPGRRRLAEATAALLEEQGFRPVREDDGTLRLRNCPFDSLATEYPETMCSLNLALLRGLLDGLGAADLRAAPVPRDGGCCVAIRPAAVRRRRPT